MDILAALTAQFHLRPSQVENTVKLIDDGNTIPFIARYRKEVTGLSLIHICPPPPPGSWIRPAQTPAPSTGAPSRFRL